MKIEVCVCAQDGHHVNGSLFRADNPRCLVLLIHGITSNRSEWGFYDLLAPRLQSAGITSLAIDLRGHGRSALPPERISLSGIQLDIEAAWGLLQTEAGQRQMPSVIVGNSFGGGVSYLFGMTHNDISRVYLTAPVLSYIKDIGPTALKVWPSHGPLGTFQYVKFSLSELLIPEMQYFDAEIARLIPTKPFTIVHGRQDSDVLFSLSEDFVTARELGSLIGLDGMDHCWAEPGDIPPFQAAQTLKNRKAAADVLADLITEAI